MKFAPIRYSLAIIRFPRQMNIEAHVPAFQDLIKDRYGQVDQHVNQGIVAHVSPENVRFEQVVDQLWQFANFDRSRALILGADFLLIHTGSSYNGHGPFLDELKHAAEQLMATPSLGVTHVTGIGLRAINLIEPRSEKESVRQYLRAWVLPTEAPDIAGSDLVMKQSLFVVSFDTSQGQMRLQAIRRPAGTFPPDLDTPFLARNNWKPSVKAADYVFLDTDHFSSFQEPILLDPDGLRARFEAIYSVSRKVFESASTPYAFKVWSRRK